MLETKVLNKDFEFRCIPKGNRFGTRTFGWCVKEIPERYIIREEYTLGSIDEVRTYFRENKSNIVNLIGEDIKYWNTGIEEYIETSRENMGVVGTRLLVNNDDKVKVYVVIGFRSNNGESSVYGNIY